jgi:SAM-dependent methyltransferase|tara:strand:- start:66 stop:707 length:642 start_codon:yes stop_codon:yes gene_type:complete
MLYNTIYYYILTCITTSQALNIKPYYFDNNIHNIGNIGLGGIFHAGLAPIFTKAIDIKAYNSINIRKKIYQNIHGNILDICCGTGYSTKPGSMAIDTSKQMINFAKIYNSHSNYIIANAENYGSDNQFDTVTCMFAFHEMPNYAHKLIIDNSIRIAKKKVIIVDLSTNYVPSLPMLSGEPYVLNYINTIDEILRDFNKTIIIKNHVDMWEYNL